ncbi:MAG: hypothetical protein ABIH00_05175 [Armatimonadota bacterium]
MGNKNTHKEKIQDFNTYLYSKFPGQQDTVSEIFSFEDASVIGNVKLRGLYSSHYINMEITENELLKHCGGVIGDSFLSVEARQKGSKKLRIAGRVSEENGSIKKISLEIKFNSIEVDKTKVYEKVIHGKIHKTAINLKCHSKFLHRQGALNRTFWGTINKDKVTINITDLGQASGSKTLLTGTVSKKNLLQSFNFSADWHNGYGYIHQIEGFLLPILIYPLI